MNGTIDGMRESTFGELISQYAPDELHLFDNLRVFIDDIGNFWFIGSEVASIMGYERTRDAIQDHVPEEYKMSRAVNRRGTSGGNPNVILISELGLYALAMRSRLPQAYQFQDWVYRVIARIRQSGGYISPDPRLKQVVDIIPEHLRPAFQAMYDRGVQSQQSIIDRQNEVIDNMKEDVRGLQYRNDSQKELIYKYEKAIEELEKYKRQKQYLKEVLESILR